MEKSDFITSDYFSISTSHTFVQGENNTDSCQLRQKKGRCRKVERKGI